MKKGVGIILLIGLFLISTSSVLAVEYDFGGMYYTNIKDNSVCLGTNSATSSCSCPTGYTSVHTWGFDTFDSRGNLTSSYPDDHNVYYCYREHQAGRDGFYDFGGMYGYSAYSGYYNNPATGSKSCPTGYTDQKAAGVVGVDYELHYCVKPYTGSPVYDFGGMWVPDPWPQIPVDYPNPITGGMTCPTGYVEQYTLGSTNVDWTLYFCYKNHTYVTPPTPPVPPVVSRDHFCQYSSQTIIKLSSWNNSHAELTTGTNYNYSICYDEIFGQFYEGENPQSCMSDNVVVKLSAETNAHAFAKGRPEFPIRVCYGDLVCRNTTGDCNANEKLVLRLSSETNAHVANASFTYYPIKICCSSGADEAFWTRSEQKINRARINSQVQMSTNVPGTASYTIYKQDEPQAGVVSNIWTAFLGLFGLDGIELTSNLWTPEEPGNYYFVADFGDKEISSLETGGVYGVLTVSEEENLNPEVEIISPLDKKIYFVGDSILFSHRITDDSSSFAYTWKEADNIIRQGNGVGTSEEQFDYTFNEPGQKNIILEAIDSDGATTRKRVSILVVDSLAPYMLSYITTPSWGETISGITVDFDASETYAVRYHDDETIECLAGNCQTPTIGCPPERRTRLGDTCPLVVSGVPNTVGFENINFSWVFYETRTSSGFAWSENGTLGSVFTKDFLTDQEHYVTLNASLNPSSTTDTSFSTSLISVCSANGNYWYDENGNRQNTSSVDGACANGEGNCCPTGFECAEAGSITKCVRSSCSSFEEDSTCTDAGCNWIEGMGCYQQGTPLSCDLYETSTACTRDTFKFAINGVQARGICNTLNSYGMIIDDCKCEWNDDTDECELTHNARNSIYYNSPTIATCSKAFDTHECISGSQLITWVATYSNALATDAQRIAAECNRTGSITQSCGAGVTKLPGFSFINFIITGLVIGLFYFVYQRKFK